MQILPMGAFFIQRKPIAMTAVTIAMILHFVPAVMAFFCTKLSRYFLYRGILNGTPAGGKMPHEKR
jgi:hypothetical protein